MIQRLITKWWSLGLCVILEATIAIAFFNYAAYGTHSSDTVILLGALTLTAGIFTIAHGILNALEGKRWLLVLNGLACSSLGLILALASRVTFRTIALLIVGMALSLAGYELAKAGLLRRDRTLEWLSGAAGIVSLGFAGVFLAFVFRWIKLNPTSPAQSFLWLGSYFAFSAFCMLGTTQLPFGRAKFLSSPS
jgi:uncharacterized membrane protein HdeD (DUF308 family)